MKKSKDFYYKGRKFCIQVEVNDSDNVTVIINDTSFDSNYYTKFDCTTETLEETINKAKKDAELWADKRMVPYVGTPQKKVKEKLPKNTKALQLLTTLGFE